MSTRARAYGSLLLAVVIWGINFHFVKIGTLNLAVIWFLAIRFLIASLSYWAQMIATRTIPRQGEDWGPFGWAGAVALTLTGFYYLQTTAISEHSTLNAAFLSATAVLWVPMFSRMLDPGKPRVSLDTWIGIALSLLGLAIVEGFHVGAVPLGDLYALGAALLLAMEFAIVGHVTSTMAAPRILPWTAAYTSMMSLGFMALALLLSPGTLFHAESETPERAPRFFYSTGWTVIALLVSGILATAIANYLGNRSNAIRDDGRRVIDAVHRSIIENLDSVVALVSAWALFRWNTPDTNMPYLGYGILILGVLTSELAIITRLRAT